MPKICLNPGHFPGLDNGCSGSTVVEAVLAREYAEIAKVYLTQVGYDVIIVQENELADICNLANSEVCDIFISIHLNACTTHTAYGTETFYSYGYGSDKLLAECIQKQILDTLSAHRLSQIPEDEQESYDPDRGLKTQPNFYVVYNTNCPSVLTEIGFLDNELEENVLVGDKEEIGKALARAVTDYFSACCSGD